MWYVDNGMQLHSESGWCVIVKKMRVITVIFLTGQNIKATNDAMFLFLGYTLRNNDVRRKLVCKGCMCIAVCCFVVRGSSKSFSVMWQAEHFQHMASIGDEIIH